jgi:hypothetical protein
VPIKRTLWICPTCIELKPTRHESVVRHIGRKHSSLGEPLSVTTGQTRNQMLALGSLAPIKRSFLGKSSSSQGFYDNSSPSFATTLAHKNEQVRASTGSADVSDTWIRLRQLELVKDTNQKVQNIINQNYTIIRSLDEVVKEIYKLKQSRNNNFVGEFS